MNLVHLALQALTLLLLVACTDGNDNSNTGPGGSLAPSPPLLEQYYFSDESLVPANIAFDPVERGFYAASRNDGSITRIAADGTETIFHAADGRTPPEPGSIESGIGGITIDAEARVLWACANNVDNIDNRIWVFDLRTGKIKLEFLLAALYPNANCNDLVLDDLGVAYVNDSENPVIYKLDPVTGEGELLLVNALLEDITGSGLGSNGIEIVNDGNTLIVTVMLPPRVVSISLPEPDEVNEIEILGAPLTFPSFGIRKFENQLYIATVNSMSRLVFSEGFSSATSSVVDFDDTVQYSSMEVAENALYAVHSDVLRNLSGEPLNTPFYIFKIDTTAFD